MKVATRSKEMGKEERETEEGYRVTWKREKTMIYHQCVRSSTCFLVDVSPPLSICCSVAC